MLRSLTPLEHYSCQSETKVASPYAAPFHGNCETLWSGVASDIETENRNLYWSIHDVSLSKQRSWWFWWGCGVACNYKFVSANGIYPFGAYMAGNVSLDQHPTHWYGCLFFPFLVCTFILYPLPNIYYLQNLFRSLYTESHYFVQASTSLQHRDGDD